ncbi:MAG TPA: sigma factor [Polyangiaceae bacterium]|nr:sigma factor [Polyangiaceae bacterium]
MKFMLMMNAPRGAGDHWNVARWAADDLKAHIAFMMTLNKDLRNEGTLVGAEGLAPPGQARVVDRRRRDPRAGVRHRCTRVGRARSGGQTAQPGDRGARSHERTGRRTVTERLRPSAPERLLRELAPRVLGAVVRRYGDFAAAEDAVQESLVAAATQWSTQGVPDDPRAWLFEVAARKMLDGLRASVSRRRREEAFVAEALSEPPAALAPGQEPEGGDDTPLLLFLCCHPALTRTSAIALTLHMPSAG